MRRCFVALAVLLPITLTGCGSGQEDAVRNAASAFQDAVHDQRWDRACAMLAPETRSELEDSAQTPCASAIPEEHVATPADPDDVEIFGTTAQLRYDGETLFLTRFGDGWRVLAAGCTPRGPKPYDCHLHGG
ncbi:hypothetical protein [Nocardioides jensenii]|uniref:hypothetical protein n=1 Tax=Nocardioides jensenii TaxID=1843 RepID=UPI000830B9D9|nr:hypothetical protein [Nocardioides jensenii]